MADKPEPKPQDPAPQPETSPQEGQPPAGADGARAQPAAPDDAAIQRRIDEAVQAELARRQAEQERAAAEKQGEYEALYSALKTEHEALQQERDALRKENGRLTKQVNAQIDAEVAAWDDPVLKLTDPGPDDLAARLSWVEKLRPELARRAEAGTRRKRVDDPPGPAALAPGANGHGGDEAAARASQAALYRQF